MISKQSTTIKRILEATPRLCLYFLLIFTPLARGSVQGWAITTIHMITLIALTAFLLDKILYGEFKWIKTPLDKPILALLMLCGISAFFSVHKQTSLWAIILLINYIAIYYLFIHTIITKSEIQKLIYLIMGVATFIAIFGIFKHYGLNPFPWWDYAEIDNGVRRLNSTFGNANHLAGYMEMTILLSLGLLISGSRQINRTAILCILPLLFIALILSVSRGGWIATFIGFVFIFFTIQKTKLLNKKRIIFPVIIGLLISGLVVLAYTPAVKRIGSIEEIDKTPNFSARLKVWGGVVKMIKDHPLLGIGPGTFSLVFTQYQPAGSNSRYFYAHNDYLHFISETGLIMFIIMLWTITTFYKIGFKNLKNPNLYSQVITIGAMAGITSILIHSISDFNLHIPSNVIYLTVLVALAVSNTFKINL